MSAPAASPHRSAASATTTPAPGAASKRVRSPREQGRSAVRAFHGTHPPWYPPTSRACSGAAGPPAASTIAPSGLPPDSSTTPGSAHGPGHGEQPRPRLGGRAAGPEPLRPEPGDERELGQRLDVVDEGRAAAHAALVHRWHACSWAAPGRR